MHEISLVKRAANKRKFLITKNVGDGMSADIEKIRDSLLSVPEPILKAMEAVAGAPFKKDDGTVMLTDDQQARLKAAGRLLQPVIGDMPMSAVSQMLSAIGAVGADALMDSDLSEDAADDAAPAAADVAPAAEVAEDAQDSADDAQEAADSAADIAQDVEAQAVPDRDDKRTASMQKAKEAGAAAYAKAMREAGYGDDINEEDEMMEKSVKKADGTDAVAKAHTARVAELEKQCQEAVQKSVALQLQLDKQEMVQKARELPHLGGSDKMVDLLLRAKQKDPEGFGDTFAVMKSWNDAMNKSDIFVEHGSQAAPEADGSAESRINAAVTNLVQKSGNLTTEQAYANFIATPEGRALYREYVTGSSNRKGQES